MAQSPAKQASPASPYANIAVIGAGAWGTALAAIAAGAGAKVTLWAREPEVVESLLKRRENRLFLAGIATILALVPMVAI